MESTFNLSVLDVSVSKADCEARHIAGGILQREQRLILRSKLKHHAVEAGSITESFCVTVRFAFKHLARSHFQIAPDDLGKTQKI